MSLLYWVNALGGQEPNLLFLVIFFPVLSTCILNMCVCVCVYVCINWRIIALQCCVGFWRVSTWFNHRYIGIRMFPPSWSSVPSYPTPLGCHRAQGWASCVVYQIPTVCLFHMVLYMFQCYSVNLPYSLLPLCIHKCVLYVSVSVAALQIGPSVPFF